MNLFHTIKKSSVWLILTTFGLLPLAIHAQDYPSKPIQIIVPYSAGSTTDVIARLVAQHLSVKLKQPVSVDNRTGGGGSVGVNALKQAPKDGYTIGLIVSGNVIQPWLSNDMLFDVRKDFINMTLMYAGPYVLTVPPNFPSNNFAEFLTYAKANSGKLFFGSSGSGTTTHLAGELLKQLANVDMTHVPYRGSPQVVAGMLSGDVQLYFDLFGTVKPLLDSGRVRALAVSGKGNMITLPHLPPIADTLPGFEVLAWTGFSAPLGTPSDVTEKLTAALRSVFQIPDVRKRIQALGVDPGGNSPTEFSQFVNSEYDKWGKIIKTAGIKAQ